MRDPQDDLNKRRWRVVAALASRLIDFGDGVRTKIDAVSDALESNAHRIAEALDHRSRQINQTLIERLRPRPSSHSTSGASR